MEHWKLTRWCTYAVQKIKYPPDREKVYRELRQHLDDRCESFLAQGLDREAAANKTCEVMGDPTEIAPSLGAIHRPYWGWAYSFTKFLCRLAASLLLLVILLSVLGNTYSTPSFTQFDPYTDTEYAGHRKVLYTELGSSFTDSGYTVTLNKAALWKDAEGHGYLCFRLKINSCLPWVERPEFCNYITARDSLGREYQCLQKHMLADSSQFVNGSIYHTAPFTWIFEAQLESFYPDGVEWVELCYDRDGRDHVLRIDLTGGAAQ